MKKYLAVAAFALVAALGLLVLRPPAAHAITVPYAQSPRIARYVEAGINVAAGAVINSAVLDLSNVSECTVLGDNSAGGSTRNLIANWLANDGTTVLYSQSAAILTTARGLMVISPTASTASLPTGVTAVPATTGKKMSFSLSGAGAAVGSLVIICQ